MFWIFSLVTSIIWENEIDYIGVVFRACSKCACEEDLVGVSIKYRQGKRGFEELRFGYTLCFV